MILLLYTFMQTSSQYSIYQKNCNLSVHFVNKTNENDVYEEHGSEDDIDFQRNIWTIIIDDKEGKIIKY